ncbi:hypothetical protein K457DRAFT_32500 [Linnemannia elongata AG-77]|uniref:Uncharacterized protein n=1 Tax=Linnemannia elongata AG-77 TaxID=1314771 RepID=A0A197JV38_9FUNG|nr:hypothetical protein K457DRAFT_32500 [Linnemannia elongata AG-77]
MEAVGDVSLDCIAADPYSRFLYGIGSANPFTQEDNRYTESTIFLLRSNASPTNLSMTSWTVVSSVDGKDFSYSYPTFTSVDCATNGRGDFTAFFRSPYRTVSPAKLLPMGISYSPDSESWTAIQGTSRHGWTSDEYLHKSFYTHPESSDVFHLLTNMASSQLIFGGLDPTKKLFIPESSQVWGSDGFVQGSEDDSIWTLDSYDYTKRGFFSSTGSYSSKFITYHRNTFYISIDQIRVDNVACPFITTSLSTMGRLGESCMFQRPPKSGRDDAPTTPHHIFGGDRNGTTFFGGIYEINKVLKIYTTENATARTFLEYNLIRTDISSEFVVDRNFQVVGGLLPGQEPFVVALTSAGLYQFTIFGPKAGSMDGPYKAKIKAFFYSAPQRVVKNMKDRTPSEGEGLRRLIGSVTAALVVLVIGGLFWRRRMQRRRRILEDKEKEKEKEKDVGSDSEDPEHAFVGKHEVHSMGLIPESESLPDVARSGLETRIDRPVSNTIPPNQSPPNARLPRYTYQDHIRDLDFSSHPRPNVVISVGEAET